MSSQPLCQLDLGMQTFFSDHLEAPSMWPSHLLGLFVQMGAKPPNHFCMRRVLLCCWIFFMISQSIRQRIPQLCLVLGIRNWLFLSTTRKRATITYFRFRTTWAKSFSCTKLCTLKVLVTNIFIWFFLKKCLFILCIFMYMDVLSVCMALHMNMRWPWSQKRVMELELRVLWATMGVLQIEPSGRLTAESSPQPLENILNKPHDRKRIHSRFKKLKWQESKQDYKHQISKHLWNHKSR